MKTINSFLNRFKQIKAPDESVRKTFAQIILKRYGIEVPVSKIKVQNSALYYNAPSVLKQDIKLNEKEILAKLNQKTGSKVQRLI